MTVVADVLNGKQIDNALKRCARGKNRYVFKEKSMVLKQICGKTGPVCNC